MRRQIWWERVMVVHRVKIIVSLWLLALLLTVTIVPMLVVKQQPKTVVNKQLDMLAELDRYELKNVEEAPLTVAVYLTKEKRVEKVPLEQYIRGVLVAEMPIEFELEALKAQAIAARTYIVRRYAEQNFTDMPVADAWVMDTVTHQAYLTAEQIAKKWAKDPMRAANIKKLNQAIEETKGLVITYSGYPILASFFSTSNGFTENSEDYWMTALPYLRSVVSPWEEELSPKFVSTAVFKTKDVVRKLSLKAVPANTKLVMRVIERSDGNRIKQIQIGNKIVSGREVREQLGLGSTQFTWRYNGDSIEFTSYGNGHGVGMSQWGAQGMAIEGRKAGEIIAYYYKGVSIQEIHSLKSIL